MVRQWLKDTADEYAARLEEQQREITDTRTMMAKMMAEIMELKANANVAPTLLAKLDREMEHNAERARAGTGRPALDYEKMTWKLNNMMVEMEGMQDRLNETLIRLKDAMDRLNDANFKVAEAHVRINQLEEEVQRLGGDPPDPDPDADLGPTGLRVPPHGPCPSGLVSGALAIPYTLADEDDGEDWIDRLYRMDAEVVG